MGGKRKVTTTTVETDGDAGGDDPGERVTLDPDQQRAEELAALNEDEGGDLFRAIDEMRATDNVKLMLTRVGAKRLEDNGYCGEMSTAEFTLENVRTRFGPGRYRVRCLGPKGFVPGGGTVNIAPSADAPAGGTAQPTNLMDYLALMDRRDTERRERNDRLLLAAIPTIGTVLGALLNRQSGPDLTALVAALKGPSIGDLTTAMTNLQTLSGAKESQTDQFVKMLDAVSQIAGADKSAPGSNWLDVVRDAMGYAKPVLEQIAAAKAGTPAALPPPTTAAPVQLPAPPAAAAAVAPVQTQEMTPPPAQGDPMLTLLPWLKATCGQLLYQARRNASAELYAEVTLDNLPAGVAPAQLREFIARDDWWTWLCKFEPNCAPYEGWFTQFRAAILDMIDNPGGGDENESAG